MTRLLAIWLAIAAPLFVHAQSIEPIKRVLPPEGLEIPMEVRTRLTNRLESLRKRLEALLPKERFGDVAADNLGLQSGSGRPPEIEVFLKAVDYAIRHREFYVERDFAKADWALGEAEKRIAELENGQRSGRQVVRQETGLVVSGFRSQIDGSAQPLGLVISEDHDFSKPCPLYVWLHGRGDKNTDLHFLYERATRKGQIAPPGAIVLHAFGRQCVGYKSAGEVDVHESIAAVSQRYRIDHNRKVLIGFSMGGAGAWQVGAHSASNWAAISPGAGFAETARYQRLTPDRYPPEYEQTLWGLNDVPGYVRNLFNTTVIAYSGELDKQIQAARVMEEAYKAEGQTLTHLIGPGVEHKYEPATLAELLKRLEAIVAKGRDNNPDEVHLQTRTLRYWRQHWVWVDALDEHWQDARVDAKRMEDKISLTTKNIARLQLYQSDLSKYAFVIDGKAVPPNPAAQQSWGTNRVAFIKREDVWHFNPQSEGLSATGKLRKHPMCQGPIDDAFVDPFLVVTPTGKSKNAKFQAWVDFELAHFRDRWRALMRGDLPEKRDVDFSLEDERRPVHLVLFGDPDSNAVIARMLEKTPASFSAGQWKLGEQSYAGDRYVPAFVFPRRFEQAAFPNYSFRYVVFNSGLTFREAHDRTNSLQNPKLPDWAVIDLSQPPNAESPGRIHDADYFDESWQLKRQPKGP